MRFPSSEQLNLPCTFAQLVPGRQHPDGRRYLPLIVLRLPDARPAGVLTVPALGVVDRHHLIAPALEGQNGIARLVFLLSNVRLEEPPTCQGLVAEEGLAEGRASSAPTAYGRVVAVPTWEPLGHSAGLLFWWPEASTPNCSFEQPSSPAPPPGESVIPGGMTTSASFSADGQIGSFE